MQCRAQSILGDLLILGKHARIVHHIPGRIRFRVSPSIERAASRVDFDRLMKSIPGVLKTRINVIVGTVVIEYDPQRLLPDMWELIAGCSGDPEASAQLEARLTSILEG
ncbi:MAG: hypothetical protein P4L55_08250 [Syntrophobacteraceae bacterium]|nr:hypothetical protein [Syntrophobacteraceae bacterium]